MQYAKDIVCRSKCSGDPYELKRVRLWISNKFSSAPVKSDLILFRTTYRVFWKKRIFFTRQCL